MTEKKYYILRGTKRRREDDTMETALNDPESDENSRHTPINIKGNII